MAIDGREVLPDGRELFDNPVRRRWWLLTKALESASLQQALEIALAADLFVVEGTAGPLQDTRPVGDGVDRVSEDGVDGLQNQNRYRH
jgi:hypothetical protein